jgi:hypothetical protein
MSLEFYRVVHIFGLLMLFCGLAASWGARSQGGQPGALMRMWTSMLHGLGLLILLGTGIAMLMLLGWGTTLPMWAILKGVIWLLLGASFTMIKNKPGWGPVLTATWVLLGTAAAYLCIYQPT